MKPVASLNMPLPSYGNSIIENSNLFVEEIYEKCKNEIPFMLSNREVWYDNGEYVKYLIDNNINVDEYIAKFRDKLIDKILNDE